jgi:tRNA threonylcarbamoyladenosine biosynthesis protein TsaB
MTNLLAIETSGETCSVGLNMDGNRFVLSEHVQKKHNERLLPMLTDLCVTAGLSRTALISRLDAVAFGCGPGSFTGVRIAAAAAQGIALSAGACIVRVSSSEAMAHRALQSLPTVPGVVTAIRSRRDLYYLAAYERVDPVVRCAFPDQLFDSAPSGEFDLRFGDWKLIGATPEWWSGPPPAQITVDAHALLDVAEQMHARGEVVDAAAGLPEYFSGDSPWRKSG